MALSQSDYKLNRGQETTDGYSKRENKGNENAQCGWQKYYLTSSLKVVKAFVDVMAKESFKEILETYQHKSEGIYAGYPPSMRETTEEKMRKDLLWDEHKGMVTLNKRRWSILSF